MNTDDRGTFKLKFFAKADRSISKESSPIFVYKVIVNVTDSAGETRSSQQRVSLGYTSIQASLSAEDWQEVKKPVEFSIKTENLNGIAQSIKGKLKVYRLIEPKKVHRKKLNHRYGYHGSRNQINEDLSNPKYWKLGELVLDKDVKSNEEGLAKESVQLKEGVYRAMFVGKDAFKEPFKSEHTLQVLDPKQSQLKIKIPFLVAAPKWKGLAVKTPFFALWGTGYEKGRAYVELRHRQETLQAYWTETGVTQAQINQNISESMRGGLHLHVWMVRENRMYVLTRKIDVPWENKKLQVKWEHMRNKLEPGQESTWTAIIQGPNAEKKVSEMVATLYDKSLDEIKAHQWFQAFNFFYQDYSRVYLKNFNELNRFNHLHGNWNNKRRYTHLRYDQFPPELIRFPRYQPKPMKKNGRVSRYFASGDVGSTSMPAESYAMDNKVAAPAAEMSMKAKSDRGGGDMQRMNSLSNNSIETKDFSEVKVRENLQETAFFYPKLLSSKEGIVKMQFQIPESLTEWQFMGFAHDKELRSALLKGTAVTSKDIMVMPNAPRFLREGDVLEFSVKVQNQSPTRQKGVVRLDLSDARTLKGVNSQYGLNKIDQNFDIPAKASKSYFWRVKVPDGARVLIYKAMASTSKLSDGEQGYLPVLSKRILVTESLPLPIRGAKEKGFKFKKLLNSNDSQSLKHQSLRVQMVSNPSWYAVMALPYLMETKHESSEAIFNRLYANALAEHIANSDPKIRRVFNLWKGAKALKSPLEKNQDIKSILLDESPWLLQSNEESEARQRLGVLFDTYRLKNEHKAMMKKLKDRRTDGGWSWQPKGRVNEYMTLYIVTGFARLRHLGLKELEMNLAIESLPTLENWVNKKYRLIKNKKLNHLTPTIAMYLYCRSFYLEDRPISKGHREAFEYYCEQVRTYWQELSSRQSQAHCALALFRIGDNKVTPKEIMTSLKERSVQDQELGRFWRDTELAWSWNRAPIETQALMIEAFDEVAKDDEMVEASKVWLLKQKQTQDWKTTKATADAVYALLLRGSDLLASDELVEVQIADTKIEAKNVEAGTGFYEERFAAGEIKPEQGEIKLKKNDEGVAWGSIYWQYLEDIDKITPHTATPLFLDKKVFIKENSKEGPILKAIGKDRPLKVGDKLVVRVILKTDRDLEYVHLKDQRGAGTENLDQVSRYHYQDGLYYYSSPRDTANHYFIDYLTKGTYVFEYETAVFHAGVYQSGIANVQCMYAPEFNSHSESIKLSVKQL